MKSRYAEHPGHPLEHVPQETLDIARAVLAESVQENDVDPEMADSIADAVVARLADAGLLRIEPAVGGIVFVPPGTAPEIVEKLAERFGPQVVVRVERHPELRQQ